MWGATRNGRPYRKGKITLLINGKQVNQATGCGLRAGKIGLQSEGGVIHFRTVKLISLDQRGS